MPHIGPWMGYFHPLIQDPQTHHVKPAQLIAKVASYVTLIIPVIVAGINLYHMHHDIEQLREPKKASPEPQEEFITLGEEEESNEEDFHVRILTPFEHLSDYIKEHYPKFDMTPYQSVEEFQKAGYPFHFAQQRLDIGLFNILFIAGADINQKDKLGRTTLDILMTLPCTPERATMISLLLQNGAEVSPQAFESLVQNCCEGCISEFKLLSLINAIVNKENINLFVNLPFIVFNKFSRYFIYEFLEHYFWLGFDIDTADASGKTLLYHAVSKQDVYYVKYFLGKGANPKIERSIGENTGPSTPFALAQAKLTESKNLQEKLTGQERKIKRAQVILKYLIGV